jgi:leucyl/phenylalanyl-tRNA--protein transferase
MNARSRPRFFPPVDRVPAHGLVGIGGKLTTEWLLDAYSHAIFPWPSDDESLAWFSPDPRAIMPLDQFHVPRRLMQTFRSGRFDVSFNADFSGVMHGCGTAQTRRHGTWITPNMKAAFAQLHREGFAHSVEVWQAAKLVGGVYGVALGGLFAAESMFYRVADASKIALVHLVKRLCERGYALLDIQMLTPHTARFGGIEIPRREYLERLEQALEIAGRFA